MSASTFAPMSAQELQEAVRHGRPVDGSRLHRILRLDRDRALLEVQAHTRWLDVAEQLMPGDARARALLASRATVGTTLARNGAGPDGRPAVAHVESLTLVTPDGHLRRIDRLTSPALFALVVGGQGLFGALYSATLRVESLVRAIFEPQPVEQLAPQPARLPPGRFRLLLPPAELAAFLDSAAQRCAEWRTRIACARARRTRDEDETFLRWARREYAQVTLWLDERGTLGGAVRCTQLRRELIDEAIRRGGAFPIACTPEATREQTQACYPQLEAFLAEQRSIDPAGRMANAWLRHQRRLLSGETCAVRWERTDQPAL